MSDNGKALQAWLTPALLGAGLMVLLYIAGQQNALSEKVELVLQRLEGHEIALRINGLLEPRPRDGG